MSWYHPTCGWRKLACNSDDDDNDLIELDMDINASADVDIDCGMREKKCSL